MGTIDTTVLLPVHSSALPGISHEVQSWYERSIEDDFGCCDDEDKARIIEATKDRKRGRGSHRGEGPLSIGVLMVLCHRDGTAWRGLAPLLFDSHTRVCEIDGEAVKVGSCGIGAENHAPAAAAVEVLLRAFGSCVHMLTIKEGLTPSKAPRISEESTDGGKDAEVKKGAEVKKDTHDEGAAPDKAWYEANFRVHRKRTERGGTLRKKRCNRLLLVILPPHPWFGSYPPASSLHPERSFTSRLVQMENLQLRLQTLNGFFSTLGGGYFLCRYLTTAVRLARSQRAVALAMGDRDLADRCTVNEAYNYVHAGEVGWALRLLRHVKTAAKERGDDLTVTMCRSARLFAKRVEKARLFEGAEGGGQSGSVGAPAAEGEVQAVKIGVPIKTETSERQQLYDDFQRIRMVHNRARI